jgi:sRNA-binding carbon storage regulator CsrA
LGIEAPADVLVLRDELEPFDAQRKPAASAPAAGSIDPIGSGAAASPSTV